MVRKCLVRRTCVWTTAAIVIVAVSNLVFGCGGKSEVASAAQGGASGIVGSTADASTDADASACSPSDALSSVCLHACDCEPTYSYQGTAADVTNCTLQLNATPVQLSNVAVFVDCKLLTQPLSFTDDAGSSWNLDYSASPARLILGADVCAALMARPEASIFLFIIADHVC